jgi:cell wall assembly regulator SMI1
MKKVWEQIITKLNEIAPEMVNNLNEPVTDEQIKQLEEKISAKFPEEFIEFYKVHNGQDSDGPGLIFCEELLSFERINNEWGIWKGLYDSKTFEDENGHFTCEPDKGIKNIWWNPLWIPITYDGSGNHYCLDLDPADSGNYGQIIRMWHDDPSRTFEASSFKIWIEKYANDLVNGKLVYSDDYYGIIEKENL